MKTPASLFHYTVGPKLPLIAAARQLVPTGYGLANSVNEKPVLWFSANPQWEPTATKIMSTDNGKTFRRPALAELQASVGLYRFRLDTRNPKALNAAGIKPMPWGRIQAVAKIHPQDVSDMVRSGLALGATPTHWWGVMEPMSLRLEGPGVLRLEICRKPIEVGVYAWEPVEFSVAVAEWESQGLQFWQTTAPSRATP